MPGTHAWAVRNCPELQAASCGRRTETTEKQAKIPCFSEVSDDPLPEQVYTTTDLKAKRPSSLPRKQLFSDPEFFDELSVAFYILSLEVVKKTSSLTYHLKKASS